VKNSTQLRLPGRDFARVARALVSARREGKIIGKVVREDFWGRLAVGVPAEEIADRMKFTPRMVFQTERAEQKRNISLDRLERMGRALGCDLVYGLVPWERSLEDRAMELVEREVWRKRYTARRVGGLAR
jgi:transcriptional regulator with XRE-family HTH domain